MQEQDLTILMLFEFPPKTRPSLLLLKGEIEEQKFSKSGPPFRPKSNIEKKKQLEPKRRPTLNWKAPSSHNEDSQVSMDMSSEGPSHVKVKTPMHKVEKTNPPNLKNPSKIL